jgi:hypothetical protein
LKIAVVGNHPDVCIISDRNKGLLSVLEFMKVAQDPEWGGSI